MEKEVLESRSLREALDLPPDFRDTKEIALGALLNPNENVQLILLKWLSHGLQYTEGEVPPRLISQWNKEAERQIPQGELYGHTYWATPVMFRLVLVPADWTWGEVEHLSRELSDAGGFLQQPLGYGTRKGMLLYNPHRMQILWEVLGEDPVEVSIED